MNPELVHAITINNDCWPDVELWCRFNIGAWNEEWYRVHADLAVFIDGNNSVTETYYFRTGEQATLFALRWS
jgi:hypothetical protein